MSSSTTSDVPGLELPDSWREYDHEVRVALLAAQNTQESLRRAVDAQLGVETPSKDNLSNISKEWTAEVLLALGGPTEAMLE